MAPGLLFLVNVVKGEKIMTINRLGKFTPHERDHATLPDGHPFKDIPGVRWSQSEDGQDWYDVSWAQPTGDFSYVMVNDTGLVTSVATDPTLLFPTNVTVYQVSGQAYGSEALGRVFNPETGKTTAAPASTVRSTALFRARIVMKMTPHGDGTLWDAVQTAVQALAEPQKTIASEALDMGNSFSVDSPYVQTLAAGLGLDEPAILSLIAQAEALPI